MADASLSLTEENTSFTLTEVVESISISANDGRDTSLLTGGTIGGNLQLGGTLTQGSDGNGFDAKFFGGSSLKYMQWDASDNALEFTDNANIKLGNGADLTIGHDGNNSIIAENGAGDLYLQSNNASIYLRDTNSGRLMLAAKGGSGEKVELYYGGVKRFETDTYGAILTGRLTVTGDLQVDGTTTTVNSTTVTVDDPVFTLGGDTAPSSDDDKDRGIEFRYHSGSAKLGFFGYDDSESAFTFFTDATNNNEVFSGTRGNLKVKTIYFDDGTASSPSVRFNLDSDTGIFRPTANNLAFSTGGAEAARFDSSGHFLIPDLNRVKIGSSAELELFSDGTNRYIRSWGGDLHIQSNASGRSLIFATASTEAARFNSTGELITKNKIKIEHGTPVFELNDTSSSATTTFTLDGVSTTINNQGTNGDLIFATQGNELLRLDGSASSINTPDDVSVKVGSSGDLTLYSNNANLHYDHYNLDAIFRNFGTDKDFIWYTTTGGTTSEVLRIDGSSSSINVPDNVQLNIGSSSDLKVLHDGSNSSITNNAGNLTFQTNQSGSDMIFRAFNVGSTGTSQYFRLDGGTGETIFSRSLRFLDDIKLSFGDNNRYRIDYDSSGYAYHQNTSGSTYFVNSENDKDFIFQTTKSDTTSTILRLDASSGFVSVGPNTPNYYFSVKSAGADIELYDQDSVGNARLFIRAGGTSGNSQIFFGDDADVDVGKIRYRHSGNNMAFETNGAERMRIDSSGNVGIGTTSPSQKLSVVGGHIELDDNRHIQWGGSNNRITGNDASDYIRVFTAGNEVARFDASGNLGIGTASPSQKLDIAAGWIELDTAYGIQWGGTANRIWGSGGNNYIKIETNGVERLRVDGQGDVGIGVTNPSEKLSVGGNVRIEGDDRELYFTGNKAQIRASSSSTPITFVNGSTELMRITQGGNVGIGVSNPSQKLHVSGDTLIEGDLTVNGDFTIVDTDVNTTEQLSITNDGTGPALIANQTGSQPVVDFQDDGTSAFYIADGGNVGIGTTSPATKLHVNGEVRVDNNNGVAARQIRSSYFSSGQDLTLTAGSAAAVKLKTGSTVQLTANNDGNVGIGNTSPTAKLQVGPSALVSGYTPSTTTLAVSDVTNGAELILRGQSPRIWFDVTSGGMGEMYLDGAQLNILSGTPTSAGSSRFYIKAMGDVGIGTTTPQRKLDVRGTSGFQYAPTAHDTQGSIVLLADGSNNSYIELKDGSSNIDVKLNTSGDSYFNGGNLGIGTTSPATYKLQLGAGGDKIGLDLSSGGVTRTSEIELYNPSDGSINLKTNNASTGGINFHTQSAQRLTIARGGNVGIGTTTPSTLLHLSASDPILKITDTSGTDNGATLWLQESDSFGVKLKYDSSSNTFFHISTVDGGTETDRFAIKRTGEVGIGTTSPSARLTVRVDGTTNAKQFRVENASGALFTVDNEGDVEIAGTLNPIGGLTAPNAPTNLQTSIVGDTINVTFTASTTSNIDYYMVYSSVDGGPYGLISIITPDDFSSTMSIIDSAFSVTGTQAYRVYAMKFGKISSALAGNISYTVSTAEPTNLSVVDMNNAFYVQWDPPSSNSRFVTAYNVYKHEHATQGSLSRSSATLVYSGMNTNYMYQISGSNNTNFHQFWVETTIAT